MELGVYNLGFKAAHGRAETLWLARLVEDLGYGSWWVGDHLLVPSPPVAPMGMEPTDPLHDPLIELAFVAAVTERIELGTGVVVLPQRHPVVLAKQVASLEVLSGDRFLLGVGAGYLEPELAALGVRMSQRAGRTDEYLDAMRSLWLDEKPSFGGEYVAFAGVDAHPRPLREPRVLIGGASSGAYRRAVSRGHGWIGSGGSPQDVENALAGLTRAAAEVDRPARLGELEICFIPVGPDVVTPDYASAGVDRLLLYPLPLDDVRDVRCFLEDKAPR